MYVNVAVLKETHPHERRVALVPSVVAKLDQARRQAAHAVGRRRCHQAWSMPHSRMSRSSADRHALVGDADVVLGGPATGAGRDRRDEGRRDPDLLHLCGQGARAGEASSGQEDHLLCHGQDSAHHAGAGDGRAVQPIGPGRLLRGTTRRDPSGPRAAENHLGGGRHRPGQSAGHGPRCRRPGGGRDRTPSWRRRRGL